MIYKLLTEQPRVVNPYLTLIVLINCVSGYILDKNGATFKACFKPIGSLLKYYNHSISIDDVKPLKTNVTRKEIIVQLGNLMTNNSPISVSLIKLIKLLVTYNKTTNQAEKLVYV